MASPAALPAQYAKFLTALGADLVAYLGIYGATWHLQPALVMAGGALAVFGVPNATAYMAPHTPRGVTTVAQVVRPPAPQGNVTVTALTPPAEPPGPGGASA